MKNKIILLFLLLIATFLFAPKASFAQEEKTVSEGNTVNVFFFWAIGCPHCEAETAFLNNKYAQNKNVQIRKYEVSQNSRNAALLQRIAEKMGVRVDGVPFTIIGDEYFPGFSEYTTASKIEQKINECLQNKCDDPIGEYLGFSESTEGDQNSEPEENLPDGDKLIPNNNTLPEKINLPIIGEVDTRTVSLPFITIAIGLLDGFNPCAMWTLIFLIGLLITMENKKRMWILGCTFIVASAAVYFVFMAAWLNIILFIGFVIWIRVLIGLLALYGGFHGLKEYWTNKDATCKVTGTEKRQKTFAKLKAFTHEKSFLIALGGIALLAFAVNLVELICSAGFPAVYTQILALNDLPSWKYYMYLLLYIFFFMIDDLFVFFIAMTTLRVAGITTKYSRYSNLIGGVLMLLIGALLLLKPEWLMFG